MERDANKYSRRELCLALGVSRSGWYHHQAKADRPDEDRLTGLVYVRLRASLAGFKWSNNPPRAISVFDGASQKFSASHETRLG
jgi:hypothetical protein